MTIRCLILAPHLEYPTRNGADILIDSRWGALSKYVDIVDILGASTLTRYETGTIQYNIKFENNIRSRTVAAFMTIAKNSHYLLEKFMTTAFIHKASKLLDDSSYDLVVFSYISTAASKLLSKKTISLQIIETHNNEESWFYDIQSKSSNFFTKKVCSVSINWIRNLDPTLFKKHIFFHVTQSDMEFYVKRFPKSRHYVFPVGCKPASYNSPTLNSHNKTQKKTVNLLFVGSLNAQMNQDALVHFKENIYPELTKGEFNIQLVIAGSNPSSTVIKLAEYFGPKTLHSNISNDKLVNLFNNTDFAILPFPYSNGSKLKLYECISHGVPFLSTKCATNDLEITSSLCLSSDSPIQWLEHLQAYLKIKSISPLKQELVNISEGYSWERISERISEALFLSTKK